MREEGPASNYSSHSTPYSSIDIICQLGESGLGISSVVAVWSKNLSEIGWTKSQHVTFWVDLIGRLSKSRVLFSMFCLFLSCVVMYVCMSCVIVYVFMSCVIFYVFRLCLVSCVIVYVFALCHVSSVIVCALCHVCSVIVCAWCLVSCVVVYVCAPRLYVCSFFLSNASLCYCFIFVHNVTCYCVCMPCVIICV